MTMMTGEFRDAVAWFKQKRIKYWIAFLIVLPILWQIPVVFLWVIPAAWLATLLMSLWAEWIEYERQKTRR